MTEDKTKAGEEIEFLTGTEGEARPPAAAPAAGAEEPGEKAAAEAHRHLKEKLKKKEAELKHLKKELDELKDAHLRRLADMENQRKRFEREKAEYQQYAAAELMLEILDISDNFERALRSEAAGAGAPAFREGVELIFRMVQSLLTKHGVRPIVLEGRAFDPAFHHAMMVEESDEVAEPTVAEELQKGYMLHDRLLRPTLVKVLVPRKGQ